MSSGSSAMTWPRRGVTASRWLTSVSVLALTASIHCTGSAVHAESLRRRARLRLSVQSQARCRACALRATDEEVPRAQSDPADGGRLCGTGTADHHHEPGFDFIRQRQSVRLPGDGSTDVFKGFRSDNAVATAEAGVRAGRETLPSTEITTLLEAATAYTDVVRDQMIVKLREANVAVLTRDLEAAETRRTVREVTRTDVAQAKARRAKAISAADSAKANLKISRAIFEKVIGHAPANLKEPTLKLKMLPPSYEDALHVAEQQSPNLAGALYREEAARHSVDLVRGELMPEVNIEASYGRQYDGSIYLQEQDLATITGRLTVPFYEGGEVQARVRQAKHSHVSRLQEIEQARTETQAAVATAWSRLMAARAQLQSDRVQVDANRVALEGVREEERVGQRTLLDVLNAEQELLDAQVSLAATKHDLVVANYAVLGAIGRLTADALALTDTVYDAEAHADEVRGQWFGLDITRPDGRREIVEAIDEASEPDELLK